LELALICKENRLFLLPHSGLPDGLFSNQKYQFGYILEGLGMKMTVWNIVRPFGITYGRLL
jgi:hypothetical protein